GPDRLRPMLFLAALIHGILIVGVTFNALAHDERGAISLEVTVSAEPERSLSRHDDAAYLPHATHAGAGTTTLGARACAPPAPDHARGRGGGRHADHHAGAGGGGGRGPAARGSGRALRDRARAREGRRPHVAPA